MDLKRLSIFKNAVLVLRSTTVHCWGHLVLVQSLPTIHGSHQSLKETHWFEAIFKNFGSAVFEVNEVKGGRMAKEWDFEAEKNLNRCKTINYSTLILCLMAIFLSVMGQNQQSHLKNLNKSTSFYIDPLLTFSYFELQLWIFFPFSSL